jgi:hypothetical protein
MARTRKPRKDLMRMHPDQVELLCACTAGCLSFYPIVSLQYSCCDLSVREKAWCCRKRGAKVT